MVEAPGEISCECFIEAREDEVSLEVRSRARADPL